MGLLHKQNIKTDFIQESWFKQNVSYIWTIMQNEKPEGYHDGVQWISFLQHTREQERAAAIWPVFDDWLSRAGTIERNTEAEGYVHKVLDWAPDRESYAQKFISDADLERHLDAMLREQGEDGGWPINFPPLSAGVHMEWRGWATVERLKTLRSFGVI